MQKGQILSLDTPANIISNFKPELWAVRSSDMYNLSRDLRDFSRARTVFPFGLFVHMTTSPDTSSLSIKDFLYSKGHQEVKIEMVTPTIEDCFMELMSA